MNTPMSHQQEAKEMCFSTTPPHLPPQRRSLVIPRAADGLKKSRKEMAGGAESCQREHPVVRETFRLGKMLLGERQHLRGLVLPLVSEPGNL